MGGVWDKTQKYLVSLMDRSKIVSKLAEIGSPAVASVVLSVADRTPGGSGRSLDCMT